MGGGDTHELAFRDWVKVGSLLSLAYNGVMSDVSKYVTDDGRTIYSFSVRSFPNLIANIYVIRSGDDLVLVDCGSGMAQSNRDLLAGFTAVAERFDKTVTLSNLTKILITHGHIDHFGGLPLVRHYTEAPIGVHILDRRVISNHEERVIFASRRLDAFLEGAGVSTKTRREMMQVYLFGKNYYQSVPVQFELAEGEMAVDGIEVYHVPGHCPGQVCLRVGDVLLTADHILSRITPHQAPESITHNMGLGHYLESLTKIERLTGIRIGLGGHEEPMRDIYGRIQAIKAAHQERLQKILDICETPHAIADISRELFGPVRDYHILLALEEAGAHVEYLYQRGELVAANLQDIEETSHPIVQYQRS